MDWIGLGWMSVTPSFFLSYRFDINKLNVHCV